jgi:hypothetical protein
MKGLELCRQQAVVKQHNLNHACVQMNREKACIGNTTGSRVVSCRVVSCRVVSCRVGSGRVGTNATAVRVENLCRGTRACGNFKMGPSGLQSENNHPLIH